MKKSKKTEKTSLAQKGKKELQKFSKDEVKKRVLDMNITGEVDVALQKLCSELPKWIEGTPDEQKAIEPKVLELVSKVMYGFETETHVMLLESFGERFRGSAKVICKQFIQDFNCTTNAEKILAETATIAFMRYLDASRRFNNCLDADKYITPCRTAFLAMLSKERDRSYRQYHSSFVTLKHMKAPAIQMNIKTNTAFVSQNQQINATDVTNKKNNESK